MSRDVIAKMTAYTLELHEAEIKLNQNESPNDFPRELKERVFSELAQQPFNIYPDFESSKLRGAVASFYGLTADNVLVGNGSNELLAATVATFVGPGTPVILPKPTFSLYEKLITIAGGIVVPIAIDPTTGVLPLDEMVAACEKLCGDGRLARRVAGEPPATTQSTPKPVVIVCSPNNPTGGVLPPNGIDTLLATGATVLFDRAYGEFAEDKLPPLHERLVTLSTFSKAWGLAALRVGYLITTVATAKEVRKAKLPYSLNIVSESMAAAALATPQIRERNVSLAIHERERVFTAMEKIEGVTPMPSKANFIFFRIAEPRRIFEALLARDVLIREYADALRVSIGNPVENDRFLTALQDVA